MSTLDPSALTLIKHFEGCSLRPNWPGFCSGVTLGWGCDIGADPVSLNMWAECLNPAQLNRLTAAKGVTGMKASVLAREFADIVVTQEAADFILGNYTIPRAANECLRAFSGSDRLPAKSFGALVSLGYNRGFGMEDRTGSVSRAGMRGVRDSVQSGAWDMVPLEIAAMSSLWPASDGSVVPTPSNLSGRRFAEAHLFEDGLRTSGVVPSVTRILGDAGKLVCGVQSALNITSDGQFGYGTLNAVLAFQSNHGLRPHGIVCPLTLKALGLTASDPAPSARYAA